MSRWESYTTVRVTSYRDSTLISTPNNPYLLWLLYKQELRVSSYNKPSQDYSAAHVHASTNKRRAQSSDRRYVLRHSGKLTINRTYIWLWLSSRLARRSLQASFRQRGRVERLQQGPEDICRLLPEMGWVWISLHSINSAYICVLHERAESVWCTGVMAARALITLRLL